MRTPRLGRTAGMVLAVSLALAGCHTKERAVTSETLVRSTRSWDGRSLPRYPTGQPEITVLKIVIPPGARLPMHKHPVINAGVLIAGELVVTTDAGKTIRLKAGDALIEVVDTWHYGRNPGRVPAEIFVVYAGTPGAAVTVKK